MRLWHAFLICFALLVAGCQQSGVVVGGKQRPYGVNTVVSLSPSTTELAPGKAFYLTLVGRTASCNFPETVKSAPVVMNGVKPNYEQILSIHPDMVLYDKSLFTEADVKKFEELQLRTFGLEGDTIDDFVACLYRLGAAVGAETQIADYVNKIEEAKAAAKGAAPSSRPKVAILMPSERGDHYISGTKSFVADVVTTCGGEVVGPDSSRFEMLSPEALLTLNPTIIISAGEAKGLKADARFKTVDAISKGHVVPMNQDALLRRGGRVPELIKTLSDYIRNPYKI